MLPLLAAYMGASALSSLGSGHGLSQVPLIGGLFEDPAQGELEDQMRANSAAWDARRPIIQQNAKNMMGQIQAAYQPVYGAMSQLYNGQQVQPQPQPPTPPVQRPAAQPSPAPVSGPPSAAAGPQYLYRNIQSYGGLPGFSGPGTNAGPRGGY